MKTSKMNQTHRTYTFAKKFLIESFCGNAISIHTGTLKKSPPAYGDGRGASINRGDKML